MEIKGYEWVTGKVVERPWGVEYRYTVINKGGRYFDDIVILPDKETKEEEITLLIAEKLAKIDVVPPVLPDPIEVAKQEKETEIREFLVVKGYLEPGQDIHDLRDARETP